MSLLEEPYTASAKSRANTIEERSTEKRQVVRRDGKGPSSAYLCLQQL